MTRLLVVTTVSITIRAFLLPWASHYRAQGWQVDALAQGISECAECTAAFDQVWGIQWSRNPLSPMNFISAPQRLQEIAKNYDLIHVHTPVAAFVTRYALNSLRRKGLKVIYTAHGFHFHRNGSALRNAIFLALEKLAGRWCDRLIVINRDDQNAALQHRLVPPDQLCYMPGIGLDLDRYRPVPSEQSQAIRHELGLEAQDTLFLSIAELAPRKRLADLLQAFAQLAQPHAHLALAGDGPLKLSLQTLCQQLGIERQVHFLGFRADIPQLMSAARCAILISQQEGLPRSVMEAMAVGLPIIGTRIRGTEDLLAQGGGILVEVGELNGITQALRWMLDHPVQAKAMGEQGQRSIASYEISKILALHDALYAEVLS